LKKQPRKRKHNIIKKLVSKLLYVVFVIGFFIGLDLFILDLIASLFN